MSNYDGYLVKDSAEEMISVREIFTIIFLRKKTIISVFIGVFGFALFLALYFLSPKYESSATIIINHNILTNPLFDAPPASDFEKLTTFHTQKELIVSKTIAVPVVDKLNLSETRTISTYEKFRMVIADFKRSLGYVLGIEKWQKVHDPTAASVWYLINNIFAKSKAESKSIDIFYTAYNAKESEETLEGVVTQYISLYHELIESQARGVLQFLEVEMERAENKLVNAENELLVFRKKDTVFLSDGHKHLSGVGFVGITDSAAVQDEFKLYLLTMEEEFRKLTSEFTPTHPAVRALQKKIDNYMSVLNEIPDKELKLKRLKRDIEVKQSLVLALRRNMDRARIVQSGMLQKMNLITVVSKPTVNESAVSPKRMLIVLIALFGGLFLGIFMGLIKHYLDHSLYSPRDLKTFLNLKTLGSIKEV
jgi:uncharacterized protein involved in exopolysaccharide biosynthesis